MSNSQERPSSSSAASPLSDDDDNEFPMALKRGCEHASTISTKNPKKAIRLANDLCSKYKDYAIAHYTKGQILANYAFNLGDNNKKKPKLLRHALESLQHVMATNPTPVCLLLIAQVLYDMANDTEAYAKVVQECERALKMDVLLDDIKDDLRNDLIQLMNKAKMDCKNKRKNPSRQSMEVAPKIARISRDGRKQEVQAKSCSKEYNDQAFSKKVEEYWRNLSNFDKHMFLDVKVIDVKGFFRTRKNKNLKALEILMDAIKCYKEKRHWITWSCCVCDEEDENEEKCEDWRSTEKHIDMHFGNTNPRVEGSLEKYWVMGSFDKLKLDSNGENFILDKVRLLGPLLGDQVVANKFIDTWLREDCDVENALESWENRRVQREEMGIEIMQEVAKEMSKVVDKREAHSNKTYGEQKYDMAVWIYYMVGNVDAKIIALKQDAVRHSAYDYREILVPLLKSFLQARLKSAVAEMHKSKSTSKSNDLRWKGYLRTNNGAGGRF